MITKRAMQPEERADFCGTDEADRQREMDKRYELGVNPLRAYQQDRVLLRRALKDKE